MALPTPSPAPLASPHVEVVFYGAASTPVRKEEQLHSLCAAGRVFLGVLRLRSATLHRLLLEMPVQTGGWMSAASPFARAGQYPRNAAWGAYCPADFPDTCFPDIGKTFLSTSRSGKLRGFRIPDPPGTGRTDLMLHAAERFGSEGCISTPDLSAWLLFCSLMQQLSEGGTDRIPLLVRFPGSSSHSKID